MSDHDATYSPDDNKLRIYPAYRLDKEDYFKLKAAGFKWAPRQKLFVAPRWTPEREDLAIEFCGQIGDEDSSMVDRAEERAERFQEYSAKRADDANAAKRAVDSIADNIPLGQPILVGHHSEKRARKDAERIENGMRKAVKMWETSKYWKSRAAGAIRHAKYKERPAVRARRIKKIQADLDRVIRSYTPKNPDDQIMQRPWYCPRCGEYGCKEHPEALQEVPHVYCGASRGGCWVRVSALPIIKERSRRWVQHYENRLAYEKAMLEDQGAGDLLAPKKRPKLPPILNYREPEGITVTNPNYFSEKTTHLPQVEMSKAQFKAIHKDRRGVYPVNGTHRVRYCTAWDVPGMLDGLTGLERTNKGHRRVAIFLTDSKTHEKPAPVEPKTPTPRTPRTVHHEPEEKTEFDAMKESLKAGVKTVTAPQLFETPKDVARKMVRAAGLMAGRSILEPSAGTGNLVRAAAADATGFDCCNITAVELNLGLVEILENMRRMSIGANENNFKIVQGDFLECNGDIGQFDVVLMNPPFKNGQDIKHILHATKFLKEGGRLVALCANGPRQNEILKPVSDHWEDLPDGTFKNQGTMVRAAMLTITR